MEGLFSGANLLLASGRVQESSGFDRSETIMSCAMVKVVAFCLGMGIIPPLMTEILISWIYKPLRNWVDFSHPLLYGNNGSLDPIAHIVWEGHKQPFVKYDMIRVSLGCPKKQVLLAFKTVATASWKYWLVNRVPY